MDIKEMKKQIEEKCDERWRENTDCNGCPLHNRYICFNTDDYDLIKENYELMFPKEEKEEENMNNNYAVINGEKFTLDDEIIKVITENQINHKKYNIGHIEIKPNWTKGYIKDSDEQDEGAIYIEDDDDNGMCITHKELPEIIEALIEINSYITKRKGEN